MTAEQLGDSARGHVEGAAIEGKKGIEDALGSGVQEVGRVTSLDESLAGGPHQPEVVGEVPPEARAREEQRSRYRQDHSARKEHVEAVRPQPAHRAHYAGRLERGSAPR